MVYAEFGGQTECIMGNWKIENTEVDTIFLKSTLALFFVENLLLSLSLFLYNF